MDIFSLLQLGVLVKLFFVTLALFYVVFTLVVYRQITLMTQVLVSKVSPAVKSVALAQVVVAGVLFLLALLLA